MSNFSPNNNSSSYSTTTTPQTIPSATNISNDEGNRHMRVPRSSRLSSSPQGTSRRAYTFANTTRKNNLHFDPTFSNSPPSISSSFKPSFKQKWALLLPETYSEPILQKIQRYTFLQFIDVYLHFMILGRPLFEKEDLEKIYTIATTNPLIGLPEVWYSQNNFPFLKSNLQNLNFSNQQLICKIIIFGIQSIVFQKLGEKQLAHMNYEAAKKILNNANEQIAVWLPSNFFLACAQCLITAFLTGISSKSSIAKVHFSMIKCYVDENREKYENLNFSFMKMSQQLNQLSRNSPALLPSKNPSPVPMLGSNPTSPNTIGAITSPVSNNSTGMEEEEIRRYFRVRNFARVIDFMLLCHDEQKYNQTSVFVKGKMAKDTAENYEMFENDPEWTQYFAQMEAHYQTFMKNRSDFNSSQSINTYFSLLETMGRKLKDKISNKPVVGLGWAIVIEGLKYDALYEQEIEAAKSVQLAVQNESNQTLQAMAVQKYETIVNLKRIIADNISKIILQNSTWFPMVGVLAQRCIINASLTHVHFSNLLLQDPVSNERFYSYDHMISYLKSDLWALEALDFKFEVMEISKKIILELKRLISELTRRKNALDEASRVSQISNVPTDISLQNMEALLNNANMALLQQQQQQLSLIQQQQQQQQQQQIIQQYRLQQLQQQMQLQQQALLQQPQYTSPNTSLSPFPQQQQTISPMSITTPSPVNSQHTTPIPYSTPTPSLSVSMPSFPAQPLQNNFIPSTNNSTSSNTLSSEIENAYYSVMEHLEEHKLQEEDLLAQLDDNLDLSKLIQYRSAETRKRSLNESEVALILGINIPSKSQSRRNTTENNTVTNPTSSGSIATQPTTSSTQDFLSFFDSSESFLKIDDSTSADSFLDAFLNTTTEAPDTFL